MARVLFFSDFRSACAAGVSSQSVPLRETTMAGTPTHKPSSRKSAAASETSESIAEQTRLFLQSGKKIEVVANGISGQPRLTARK